MGKRRQFEAREYGRIRHEIEFRQILALQMERERLIQVRRKFIKGPALRHDREVQTLRHVLPLSLGNPHLDDSLHGTFSLGPNRHPVKCYATFGNPYRASYALAAATNVALL
jgi:hypothetical protein